VFLLGMMGAGKSSVGRILAERWGATFIDLDQRVERLFGASVAALFEQGEDYFRACERAGLRSLLAEPGFAGAAVVVATGGGVVVDPANLDDIAAVGISVYLELAPASLAARLSTPAELAARPLLDADPARLTERLTALLGERAPAYRRADRIVDADATPEEVADRVARALTSD
jgi:shikimate kinase